MNASCACITFGVITNVVAVCTELASTNGNSNQDFSYCNFNLNVYIIVETAELNRVC